MVRWVKNYPRHFGFSANLLNCLGCYWPPSHRELVRTWMNSDENDAVIKSWLIVLPENYLKIWKKNYLSHSSCQLVLPIITVFELGRYIPVRNRRHSWSVTVRAFQEYVAGPGRTLCTLPRLYFLLVIMIKANCSTWLGENLHVPVFTFFHVSYISVFLSKQFRRSLTLAALTELQMSLGIIWTLDPGVGRPLYEAYGREPSLEL